MSKPMHDARVSVAREALDEYTAARESRLQVARATLAASQPDDVGAMDRAALIARLGQLESALEMTLEVVDNHVDHPAGGDA